MARFIKKSIDKLLRTNAIQSVLSGMVAFYIHLVYKWSQFELIGKDIISNALLQKSPVIIVFWHNRMVMLPMGWIWDKPFYMLSSRHGISLMLVKILSRFGVHSILGSTNRHAVSASIEIIDKLREGSAVGITPDGPRGPSQVCSPGIIRLAHVAAKSLGPVTIIPVSYAVSNFKRMRSWDKLIIPFPSKKGVFIVGESIQVTSCESESTLELLRKELEDNLNNCTEAADKWINITL